MEKISAVSKGKKKSLDPKPWYMRMKDVPCFILGNAPSLNNVNLSLLDNYFTVGINRIFFKYDPTVLIWQDLALWVQETKRIKVTKAVKYCRRGSDTAGGHYNFVLEGREPKITHDVTKLYGRGSSGSISYQFVWALGCDPIALVGMDCRNAKNGNTDFYGKNPMHKRHTLPSCEKGLRFIKQNTLKRTVINCSESRVFEEKKSIEEVIEKLGDKRSNREKLTRLLLTGEK